MFTQPHFEVADDERWQACELEALESVVLVGLVLFLRGTVELGQEAGEGYLRDDVLPRLVRVQGWRWQVTGQVQPLDLLQVSWMGTGLKECVLEDTRHVSGICYTLLIFSSTQSYTHLSLSLSLSPPLFIFVFCFCSSLFSFSESLLLLLLFLVLFVCLIFFSFTKITF